MPKTLLLTATVIMGSGFLAVAAQSETSSAVFTEAQAAAGRAAYESVCINCHTESLRGRSGNSDPTELPLVSSLSPDWQKMVLAAGGNGKIPPLAGEAFLQRWGARSTQALAARIVTAIGGFPPAGLDDKTANNLAAYFLKVSGAKPGMQELGTPETAAVLIRDVMSTVAAR
jgi:mono/diheme cytochrome c family protein